MTKAKHTPGPWTQGWSKNGIDCVWLDGKTEPVSGMGDDNDWIDCVTEANARLISAAPELLDTLQKLLERISYYASLAEEDAPNIEQWAYTEGSSDVAAARAAIAKALGE